MFFGELPVSQTPGCVLAHSLKIGDIRFRKGRTLSQDDVQQLASHGIEKVTVARLDENDMHEDIAASRLAEVFAGMNIAASRATTGRVNLSAERDGLFSVSAEKIEAINSVDEGITIATLSNNTRVTAGRMLATIKIIPYAVDKQALERALAIINGNHDSSCLALHPFKTHKAFMLQTAFADTSHQLLDKTLQVTDDRLALRQCSLIAEMRIPHETAALSEALSTAASDDALYGPDWLLVSCASAISDRNDVLPAAIKEAGGKVTRFGLPVDPGNLMLIGELNGKPVLGLPGCARSSADNGLDRILDRLAADQALDQQWLASLAVGGLLNEIPDRPRPRRHGSGQPVPRIGLLLLAAGRGTRFGSENKLLAECAGLPLITQTAARIAASGAERLLCITGRQSDRIESAIDHGVKQVNGKTELRFANNPMSGGGMASSLIIGVSNLSANDAIIVCLGDMPAIKPETLKQLSDSFHAHPSASMIIPCCQGRRGNPVLIGRSLFDAILDLEGDAGARQLIESNPESVLRIEVDDEGILMDCDTPEDLEKLATKLQPVTT